MDACVQLSDSTFRDIQLLPCEPDDTTTVESDFLAARLMYVENLIFINERTELLDREASLLVIPEKVGFWRLKGGRSYVVGGFANEVSAPRGVSVLKKSVLDDGASRTVSEWEGRVCDPDLISGYEAVIQIEGSSELSRLHLSSFEHQIVSILPDAYDCNVIFELPPVSPEELAKNGGMLAEGLTREEHYDLPDSLSPVAAPETFTNLIRSIRKSSKEPREESDIISLQQRINFRYVLRSLFIGEAGPYQRAHVFKMSLNGDGSGLDLLRRMLPGEDLYGSWDLSFEENVLMPNTNAAESVHAMWKRSSRKKKQSLLEVTMEDNTMAIIQIARYQSFMMGRGGGNGPSMFELDLRAADRLGTSEAFERAFENALRRTEPLAGRMHTVNGDIRTVTHKRKGPVTSTVNPEDTHRHDRIAVTTPVVRRPRGRLFLDEDLRQTPASDPNGPTYTANKVRESVFFDEDFRQTPNMDGSGPSGTANVVREPVSVHQGPPQAPIPPEITTISNSSDRSRPEAQADVVIDSQTPVPANQAQENFTGQTFRTRPPTMGTPTPIRTNAVDPPIVATRGIPPPIRIDPPIVTQHGQPVIERDCDKRFWHLSRINISGNLACNATLSGPNAPRDLCKTKIKSSGVKVRGVATVAPSFCGYRRFKGVDRPHQFWFCPNMQCVRSKGLLACKFQMPRVTETIPVLTVTNLTQAEVDFLTSKGFVLVQRVPETFTRRDYAPNAVEMRINVNSYP
ncbi:hypothetical protein R1sor_014826 [Riccia sorocarpa]|uniref:Uncharacterized protein n=1 Tax=Riccia sorocarpa TaxID=122646 RepID=A0ABD3HAH7_9MARC